MNQPVNQQRKEEWPIVCSPLLRTTECELPLRDDEVLKAREALDTLAHRLAAFAKKCPERKADIDLRRAELLAIEKVVELAMHFYYPDVFGHHNYCVGRKDCLRTQINLNKSELAKMEILDLLHQKEDEIFYLKAELNGLKQRQPKF